MGFYSFCGIIAHRNRENARERKIKINNYSSEKSCSFIWNCTHKCVPLQYINKTNNNIKN